MKTIGVYAALCAALSVVSTSEIFAAGLSQDDEASIERALEAYAEFIEKRQSLAIDAAKESDPFGPPNSRDPFPEEPIRRPNFNDISNLVPAARHGASFIVALEVLYQTLNFYGVKHHLERSGNNIQFKIIESKRGYFQHLDRISVTFALQEFSRYLNAHMCNTPTVENYYRVFSQVPAEEIGLRFKFDMAWALLGNHLPREPNKAFTIGTRWAALGNILNNSTTLRSQVDDKDELNRWANMITDIINVLQHLNRLMCFIDVRPKPKDEIVKRIVINKILGFDRDLSGSDRYPDLVDEAKQEGERLAIERIRAL